MLNKSLFSSNSDEWATPQLFFDNLDREFHFTLDVCASKYNFKCKKYFDINTNGLLQEWQNEVVFCNPPYSNIKEWVKKCYEMHRKYNITICLLIPARTDTIYFHEYIYNICELRFIKGRLKFNDGKGCAPFPSMLCIYRGA